MKKSKKLVYAAGAVSAFLASSLDAFAALDGTSALNTMEQQLRSLASPLVNVISILVGVTGVTFVAINLIKYLKSSERDADNSFLKIGVGLIAAAVIIQVIKAVVGF